MSRSLPVAIAKGYPHPRRVAGLLAAIAVTAAPLLVGPAPAGAQDAYPNRQLRMVFPE